MPWFKVDDNFCFHPKAMAAGNAALGLWVRAGSWCGANLTGGALPRHMIGTLGAQARDARRLVSAGLWSETDEGYQFNSWDEYQPTKAQVEAERAATRERQRRFREAKRNAVTNTVTNSVTNAVSNAAPTRPDLTNKEEAPPREDVEHICNLLADLIATNIDKRPRVAESWRTEARRLIDVDKRPISQIEHVARWATSDPFWKQNILSMPKFRQKYDGLLVAAREAWKKGQSADAPSPDGDIDIDAILGRDLWTPPPPPADITPGTPAYQQWLRDQRAQRRADREREARNVLARRGA